METGSEASSPRTPLAPSLPVPDGAALPAWLSDWRLRTALASRERFEARGAEVGLVFLMRLFSLSSSNRME